MKAKINLIVKGKKGTLEREREEKDIIFGGGCCFCFLLG